MIKKEICKIFFALSVIFNLFSCQSIKPYEKEYLLHPIMNDQELSKLQENMPGATRSKVERLSSSGPSTSGTSSCPTCGG